MNKTSRRDDDVLLWRRWLYPSTAPEMRMNLRPGEAMPDIDSLDESLVTQHNHGWGVECGANLLGLVNGRRVWGCLERGWFEFHLLKNIHPCISLLYPIIIICLEPPLHSLLLSSIATLLVNPPYSFISLTRSSNPSSLIATPASTFTYR